MLNLGSKTMPPSTKSIVNYHSDGNQHIAANCSAFLNAGKNYASGALSAGVYKELVSVSGGGHLKLCGLIAADATSRQMGIKIVVDGTTVFDAYSNACTTQYGMLLAVGLMSSNTPTAFGDVIFNSSLSISVKSSVGETDKVTLVANYETK